MIYTVNQMRILGIETSADETSAAVVDSAGGRRPQLLSNVTQSQIELHKIYGGIVPEVSARSHIEVILPVIEAALQQACDSIPKSKIQNLKSNVWDQIDAIAVTYAPGLIGSLLIGALAARTLALVKNKPLYPIHHVKAHVYANFLTYTGPLLPASERSPEPRKSSLRDTALEAPLLSRSSISTAPSAARSRLASHQSPADVKSLPSSHIPHSNSHLPPEFPILALIVSGGHTQLVLFKSHQFYEILGRTQDDAVGEAFDKVAKILGLPYPGGPSIAKAAENGDSNKYQLPKAKLTGTFDFSFSGLKTATLRAIQKEVGKDFTFPSHQLAPLLNEQQINDFAASFQKTAIETLVDKTLLAYRHYSPASVVIAGGVAASQELRRELSARLPIPIDYPPMFLCTDNAAMIATCAYYESQFKQPVDPRVLEVVPSLSM
jgi:N6-L-threonylcarbamoyladenine synthase